MARHDGDRDRVVAGVGGNARDQRPGAFLAGARGQHQDRDILVFLDQLEDFLGGVAFADRAFRRDAGDADWRGSSTCSEPRWLLPALPPA